MAITGTQIVQFVRPELIDPAGARWSDSDLMRYINSASVEIVGIVPSANSKRVNVTLTAGAVQTIPDDGAFFLNLPANVGGRAIRKVSLPDMDAGHPNWRNEQPLESGVRQFMFDENTPTQFLVYPPAGGTEQVELVYAVTPAPITALTQTLPLPDKYLNAYINYVLFRAYARDSDFAANQEQATWYFQQFAQGLGVRLESRQKSTPNQRPTA